MRRNVNFQVIVHIGKAIMMFGVEAPDRQEAELRATEVIGYRNVDSMQVVPIGRK